MAGSPKYYRSTFTFAGRRYERKSKKSQREADRKADAFKAQLERGEVGISSNMSVRAWALEWLQTYKEPVVGHKTYLMYKGHIDNDIIPAIGSKALKDVTDVDLQKIINSRAGQSKSSIDKICITIKSMFNRAHISGLIMRNPVLTITKPTAAGGTHRSITATERAAILAVAETHRAGLWIKLLLYCGLRPNETRALQWRHIDFDKKIVRVETAMKAGTRDIGEPKSAAGVRNVPIPDILVADLSAVKAGPFMPVIARKTEGLHHTESSMRGLWDSFIRSLDIYMGAKLYRNKIIVSAVAPDLTAYCLRHTYGTDLQDMGVPINIARYLMGHASITVTAQVYTHTTEKAVADAAKLINAGHKKEAI